MIKFLKTLDPQRFIEKFSAAVVYGILSSVALNLFLQPGGAYSGGATGLAQIVDRLISDALGHGHDINSIGILIWVFNVPLLMIAWSKISKKFTVYTLIAITLSAVFIQIIPRMTLTTDPVMNAVFGGAIMGAGVGYAMKNGCSSGGTDIVSLVVRKRTGRSVGFIGMIVNGVILVLAGIVTSSWQAMFYSLIAMFINTRVLDVVYNKQKKMQVTIVTRFPDAVTKMVQDKLIRGVTVIKSAEGGYTHESTTILITVITAAEVPDFREIMEEADPKAFISIAENVKIIGNFQEDIE